MKKRMWIAFLVVVTLGLAIQAFAESAGPVVGSNAPQFSLKNLAGNNVGLRQVVGENKVTLVNFWATWCPPCRKEIPELNKIYSNYRNKSVEILGVNLQEDAQTLASFVANNEMKFPVLLDIDGKIGEKYRVYYIPTTFVLDRKGKIREIIQGGASYERLKDAIERTLKEGA